MRYALLGLCITLAGSLQAAPPPIEKYLHEGQLAKGEQAMEQILVAKPFDDEARFSLGLVRFLRAVERLGQKTHEYGVIRDHTQTIPFLRLPLHTNPNPNRISHHVFRSILDDFNRDLALAEATLAPITDAGVSLTIELAEVRLDLDGDGRATDKLSEVMKRFFGRNLEMFKDNPRFRVRFDRADVPWFRGYCHLLMGLSDFLLAFDGETLFDAVGHLMFTRPRTKNADRTDLDFTALIAAAQNLKVKEPDRLKRARLHWLKVCETSRETWKLIALETDDENEWLPGPQQRNSAIGIRITKEMVDSWHEVIGEMEKVLDGKAVIPILFNQPEQGKGFHLRAFLEDPPEVINLMDWAAQVPDKFWRQGPVTDDRVWGRAERAFGGEFMGFAMWFN